MELNQNSPEHEQRSKISALLEVLVVSTKLGLTSFGGPVAHLGYFHNEYILRRKWMDERSYADLVALCQFLPGPASSQVGIGIGVMRAGILGGLTAWIGFTLPSILFLVLFAFLMQGFDIHGAGWIHGLKIVAVAVVSQAILSMGVKLTPDPQRATIAVITASIALLWQTAFSQILLIALAGLIGLILYRRTILPKAPDLNVVISRRFAVICLITFGVLLIGLPLLRQFTTSSWVVMFDSFYRAGSLVFGGGHVVLPLLEREVVQTGLMSHADFLSGYGITQAVPGPLFTFASYLGAMMSGVTGALIATMAVFLPAFLLIVGTLPFWNSMRRNIHMQGALMGINAAVVGILLASLYNPLWTTSILSTADFALLTILILMLIFWKLPPWTVVVAGAVGGIIIDFL